MKNFPGITTTHTFNTRKERIDFGSSSLQKRKKRKQCELSIHNAEVGQGITIKKTVLRSNERKFLLFDVFIND